MLHRLLPLSMRRIADGARALAGLAALAAVAACDNGATPTASVKGASTLSRFYAIGTGLTMGAQSGGVLYDTQVQSWPSLLAKGAGVTFEVPALRTPGCPAARVAPLQTGRRLNATQITVGDSACAGALGAQTLPYNDLALIGATAWDALHATPKSVTAVSTNPFLDRTRYPLVLGNTQSQVTAVMVQAPTFVSIELGWSELLPAITKGQLIAATSYNQSSTAWTYVAAARFDTVFRAIADSVALTGAKVVALSVPMPSATVGLRAGSELWAERTALSTYGIVVNADCNGSTNLVYTPAVIPIQATFAAATSLTRNVSCADVPGTTDFILTPAELATLDAQATAMNTTIQAVAQAKGWAFADIGALFSDAMNARGAYKASTELGCAWPYGQWISLDGVHPNGVGHRVIANLVAQAVNAKFGFALPTAAVNTAAAAQLCP